MRKPSRRVDLEDIIASNIIGEDARVLALALRIHLALEAILIEILNARDPSNRNLKLSFPQKTRTLVDLNAISLHDGKAFNRVNDFRNDFAHVFGHSVTAEGLLELARALEADGVDFSDSVGSYSQQQAVEYYGGVVGILEEIGWCVLGHAAERLKNAGGRDIFSSEAS